MTVYLHQIGCMDGNEHGNNCNRPAQTVFIGADGRPHYRCGKCTRVLQRRRNDVELLYPGDPGYGMPVPFTGQPAATGTT